ncbi:hypothetical protein CASP1_00033 [Alcaligenes phage CASP1]|nr:hypothetical protein CASP1_00033 [Alcaligenes phage CASP1]
MLTIKETQIAQNENGLYSLNDLHKAAGGESKHQPSNWLRLDSTKDLIEEINKPRSSEVRNAIQVSQGGRSQGTFVCKEMVYAYAMWISPSFMIKVINVFDAVSTGNIESALRYAGTAASQKRLEKLEQEKSELLGSMGKRLLSQDRQAGRVEILKRHMVSRIKDYLRRNFVNTNYDYDRMIACATDYESNHETIAVEVLEALVLSGVVYRSKDNHYALMQ